MSACPKCSNDIGTSDSCPDCGWRRNSVASKLSYPNEPERVKCAHDGCFISAAVKIQTKHGWANLCTKHYESHFQEQGRETCKRLGLETVAQQRAYVVAGVGRLLRKREPGDDDEVVA